MEAQVHPVPETCFSTVQWCTTFEPSGQQPENIPSVFCPASCCQTAASFHSFAECDECSFYRRAWMLISALQTPAEAVFSSKISASALSKQPVQTIFDLRPTKLSRLRPKILSQPKFIWKFNVNFKYMWQHYRFSFSITGNTEMSWNVS